MAHKPLVTAAPLDDRAGREDVPHREGPDVGSGRPDDGNDGGRRAGPVADVNDYHDTAQEIFT